MSESQNNVTELDPRALLEEAPIRYRKEFFAEALRRTGNGHDAFEVLQNTWEKATRNIGNYKGGDFEAWLRRILCNAINDHWRKKRRHGRGCSLESTPAIEKAACLAEVRYKLDLARQEDDVPELIGPGATGGGLVDRAETYTRTALSRLKEGDRKILLLWLQPQATYESVGAALGISAKTAGRRIKEILAAVRRMGIQPAVLASATVAFAGNAQAAVTAARTMSRRTFLLGMLDASFRMRGRAALLKGLSQMNINPSCPYRLYVPDNGCREYVSLWLFPPGCGGPHPPVFSPEREWHASIIHSIISCRQADYFCEFIVPDPGPDLDLRWGGSRRLSLRRGEIRQYW